MREGDNTYRPGEHVGESVQKPVPVEEATAAPEPASVAEPPAGSRCEGDNTYRPGEHPGEAVQKPVPVAEAREPAPTAPEPASVAELPAWSRREGDNTYRPADNVSAEDENQAVNKAPFAAEGPCEAESDSSKAHVAGEKGTKRGTWFLPVLFVIVVTILSALFVKSAFVLRDALALPIVLRELACAGVLVCIAAILYAFYVLARIVQKLPRIEQASMSDTAARQAKLLRRYLRSEKKVNAFPDGMSYDEYAKRILHKEECAETLRWLSKDPDDYGDWMERFRSLETIQDEVASKCIRKRAGFVALATAASPWKFLDVISVLYHTVGMMTELAGIYRRRITRFQAVRLGLRGLVSAGVAYGAQAATETIASKVSTMVSTVGTALLGKIAAKTAEGGVNCLLVSRLGQRMKSSFKPRARRK